MKYIKKDREPEAFRTWKALSNEDWQPSWENFQKPERVTVHEALLKEQGYICCYCGRRIDDRKNSHIEHLKPRTLYSDLQLEYTNLIEHLGLNIPKLQGMRSEAIAGVLLSIDGLSEEEIRVFAESYEQLDADGKYRPFCAAIAYFLNAYYPV